MEIVGKMTFLRDKEKQAVVIYLQTDDHLDETFGSLDLGDLIQKERERCRYKPFGLLCQERKENMSRIMENSKGGIFNDISVKFDWLIFMWIFHGNFGLQANVK